MWAKTYLNQATPTRSTPETGAQVATSTEEVEIKQGNYVPVASAVVLFRKHSLLLPSSPQLLSS